MKQEKKLIDNIIAKVAYQAAKQNVNSICFFYYYQPQLPDSLKKLKESK